MILKEVFFIRTVIADLSEKENSPITKIQQTFGGYAGEHKETELVVNLPNRLLTNDIDYYYFEFGTSYGSHITSFNIYPSEIKDGKISTLLWKQLVQYEGNLIFCVTGIKTTNNGGIVIKGKTTPFILKILKSPSGREEPINISETKTDLQKAIDECIINAQKSGLIAGQKTSQGGEIFNDYDTNKALGLFSHTQGTNNITGCLGYKITSVNPEQYVKGMDSITFTLNTDDIHFANLAIDDIVSWRVDWNYNYAGTITAVDSTAKTVTVNGVWGEEQPAFNPDEPYDNYLWIPNKPEAGDQPLGLGSSTTGINNINNSDGSVVEGKGNISDGRWSHIEGKNNKGAYLNHIEGQKNISYAQSVHIEGEENSVEKGATNAHIEGSKNIVTKTGYFSHTQGRANENSGQVTHIEGLRTKATKNAVGGHAEGGSDEGNFTVVNNYFAHAENEQTQANGRGSHSQGLRTQANGDYSDSSGVDTQANGVASVSEGIITEANSRAAESHGIKTIANGYAQFVVGQYNIPIGSGSAENPTVAPTANDIACFIVGNGLDDNNRSNAFVVFKDGHAEIQTQGSTQNSIAQVGFVKNEIEKLNLVGKKTSVGGEIFNDYNNNIATGQYSHAQNNKTTAKALFSTSMGDRTIANGLSSLATGVISETNSRGTFTSGVGTLANGYAQMVVGQYNAPIGSGSRENPTDAPTTNDIAYFIVGNGTSDTNRNNAFVVYKDGSATIAKNGTEDTSVVQRQFVITELSKKQNVLISGENIKAFKDNTSSEQSIVGSGNFLFKTINGNSIFGDGNLQISGNIVVDSEISETSTNPVQNRIIAAALKNLQDKLWKINSSNDYLEPTDAQGIFSSKENFKFLTTNNLTLQSANGNVNIDTSKFSLNYDNTEEAIVISFKAS